MRLVSPQIASNFDISFVSMQKDREAIIKKLFVESRPYSDILKRLLVIQKPDCLDATQHQYKSIIEKYTVSKLIQDKYIRMTPKLGLEEFEDAKSFIFLKYDSVAPSINTEFYNHTFDIFCICPYDQWELDDYGIRPWVMAGYINGILHNSRLSGIGKTQLLGCAENSFDENWGFVNMRYITTHSLDDKEKVKDVHDDGL